MLDKSDLPEWFLDFVQSVTAKRARIIINHILEHGFITTEDIEVQYGYKHPPRAARDVREQGIPLETFSTKSADGKTIAAYRFGDLSQVDQSKLGGRKTFAKSFKDELIERQNHRCAICNEAYEDRYLQIDHCIPYEVQGDTNPEPDIADYMLLCASCNRSKSWSCEHCENWLSAKRP